MKVLRLTVALLAVVCADLSAQTSLWNSSSLPGTSDVTDDSNAVTLGLAFYSDVPGTVTGVRFFKGLDDNGTHTGTLWSSSGSVLGQVTFSGETASGWQQANFPSPISISANTRYVISYLAPNGNYARDQYYSWPSLNTSPLHVSGAAPGVFAYGSSTAFPSSTWHGSNYWVDVVFTPAAASAPATGQSSLWPSTAAPQVPQATNDSNSVTLGVMFSSDVPGTVTGVRFYKGPNNIGTHVGSLWSSTGALLGQVTFSGETAAGWQQANFSSPISIAANTPYVISYLAPDGNYACDQYYSWPSLSTSPLHVSGAAPGVFAYGSSTAFPSSAWHGSNYWVDVVFTPAAASAPAAGQSSLWPSTAAPQVPQATNDSNSVTLGVTFSSDVPGSVTGVRFYKGPNNIGTHVGSLWSSTGALLGQVTFSGETAAGWQQANFSSPISIAANTPYVISYLAPDGNYACDQYYSWSSPSTSPLHVSGAAPGVFAYGSSTAFPSSTWHGSNYWVDLAFTPANAPGSSTYSITGNVSGSAATLALSGPVSSSATTGAGGAYTFSGVPNGTYTVTPSQSGVTFTPSTAKVSITNSSMSGVNFAATVATSAVQHSVTIGWNASSSANVVGYNVYRGTEPGGPYIRVNTSLLSGTGYTDDTVISGQTYYYVTTAINSDNLESEYSNVATAAVPAP